MGKQISVFLTKSMSFGAYFKNFGQNKSLMAVFWAIFSQKKPCSHTLFWYAQKSIFSISIPYSVFLCKKQKKNKFLTFRRYSNCPMKAVFGIFSQVKTPYCRALSWSKFAQNSMFRLFFQLLSWFFLLLGGAVQFYSLLT